MASVTTSLTTAAGPASPREVVQHAALRLLHTNAEFQLCAQLQREIWGAEFDGVVPASLIRVATHVGALAIGAFSPEGRLIGFVFGLTGVLGGATVHWSHMLGVVPEARDQGLGRRLKEHQRAELARRGIRRSCWTFDPLQARNAHLNLNRLGARVVEYVPDMYGDTHSPLHAAGTDRLVVESVTSGQTSPVRVQNPEVAGYAVHSPFPLDTDLRPGGVSRGVLIEVPWDFQAVVAESPVKAREWRLATRQYFQWALTNRYRVAGLHRDVQAKRAFYVVERANEALE